MAQGPFDEATEWLLDQMHNPSLSVRWRIECAVTLLKQSHHERSPIDVNIRVIVPGIDPALTTSTEPKAIEHSSVPLKLLLN
jgi:hypothetical protein